MSNVSVPVIVDSIVEKHEEFDLTLNVPSSLSPAIKAGGRDSAEGVIIDSTSKCTVVYNVKQRLVAMLIFKVLIMEFGSGQFIGSESSGFIEVIVRIREGSSSTPIIVTVTPSVQSPVSAMGRQ